MEFDSFSFGISRTRRVHSRTWIEVSWRLIGIRSTLTCARFGVYSDAGIWQCDAVGGASHLQGSLGIKHITYTIVIFLIVAGHEEQDAATFASWGMDALKYDNCWPDNATFTDYDQSGSALTSRFATMSQVLSGLNMSVVYSICEWGVGYDLGTWAAEYGDTWRISNDIQDNWSSIWRIVNEVVPYVKYTGVGRYPDMDMLTIGLGVLSDEEERFEMTMWAINKSPLVIGAPMDKSITGSSSLNILSNKDAIAINQDQLGEQATLIRRYTEEQYDVWAGNLTQGRKIVAITNWSNDTNAVSVDVASALRLKSAGNITDIWTQSDLTDGSLQMNLSLTGHEARLLVLSDIEYAEPLPKGVYYDATNATLGGGANVVSCDQGTCQPTSRKVEDVVNSASVTFERVSAPDTASTRLVGVDFINYDVALASAWTNGTNTRNLTVAVNDAVPKRWAFPISGGNWSDSGRMSIEVGGFEIGVSNTVKLAALDEQYGPDIVGIEVF